MLWLCLGSKLLRMNLLSSILVFLTNLAEKVRMSSPKSSDSNSIFFFFLFKVHITFKYQIICEPMKGDKEVLANLVSYKVFP